MDEVSQIRERIDLVSFISEYIPLKKTGRNFKAICPFHNEKTPSFIVSPERQIWHCFGGCGKGGDVYTFLMEYENLEFIEALRILAKRTGVNLRESSFQAGFSSKKELIYKLNKVALDFYHYVLTRHEAGKKARDYLIKDRKLNTGLIDTFMLGFSPREGASLSNYLISKKKYKKENLVEAGLAFHSGSGVLDFFKGRIMFPLFDHRGNVVGFSGRAIEEFQPAGGYGGKYINTRDTIAYHKGSVFFGLNIAKEEIKKLDKAIIVEGELDVISCFSVGVKNAIAIKGTALTEDQSGLIARFTKNICLCFDKDDAGYEATKRSIVPLEKKGINITTCILEKAKDADEAIRNNPLSFKKSIKKDIPVYDFLASKIFSSFEKDRVYGKRRIAQELLPIFAKISNEIVKEHYLKKLGLDLDVSLDALTREMEKIEKKETIRENVFVDKNPPAGRKKSRTEILEDYLLALIVQCGNPQSILEKCSLILKDYKFTTESYQKIINYLSGFFKQNIQSNSRNFLKLIPKELVSSFDASYLFPLPSFDDEDKYVKEAEKVSRELRALFLKNKIKEISDSLKKEEKDSDLVKIEDLEKELSLIIDLLGKN